MNSPYKAYKKLEINDLLNDIRVQPCQSSGCETLFVRQMHEWWKIFCHPCYIKKQRHNKCPIIADND